MKITSSKNLAFLSILAVAACAVTSLKAADDASVGTLGKQYGLASISSMHRSGPGVSVNPYAVDLGANTPIAADCFDLTLDGRYLHIAGAGQYQIELSGAAYTSINGIKPFVGPGLTYGWNGGGGFGWAIIGGVEIPAGKVSITPRIVYGKGFKSGSAGRTTCDVAANYWFTPTTAVNVDVAYLKESGVKDMTYTAGMLFKF